MYCYRCNGTLDLGRDTCGKCGTDIRIYKKIVYASNRAYNSALVKANSRNLSGAREDLRLVVPAPQVPRPVKRDGDHEVDVREKRRASQPLSQHRPEIPSRLEVPPILQRLGDVRVPRSVPVI